MVISQVDFLKYIFKNDQHNQSVSVSSIAKQFQITTPSVTQALRAMNFKKWVEWEPRKQITITRLGKKEAIKLIRRHRILECFLVQVMKLDLWEVHVEAEKLEHVISDSLLKKMNELCGNPKFDPHGHAIPSESGVFPKNPKCIKLSQLDPEETGVVCLIDDTALGPMLELVKNKIKFGSEIKKITVNQIRFEMKILTLSAELMNSIGVKLK